MYLLSNFGRAKKPRSFWKKATSRLKMLMIVFCELGGSSNVDFGDENQLALGRKVVFCVVIICFGWIECEVVVSFRWWAMILLELSKNLFRTQSGFRCCFQIGVVLFLSTMGFWVLCFKVVGNHPTNLSNLLDSNKRLKMEPQKWSFAKLCLRSWKTGNVGWPTTFSLSQDYEIAHTNGKACP